MMLMIREMHSPNYKTGKLLQEEYSRKAAIAYFLEVVCKMHYTTDLAMLRVVCRQAQKCIQSFTLGRSIKSN